MNDRTQTHLLATHECATADTASTVSDRLPEVLAGLMAKRRMTPLDLSDDSGVPLDRINSYLDVTQPARFDDVALIAAALGVKVDKILATASEPKSPIPAFGWTPVGEGRNSGQAVFDTSDRVSFLPTENDPTITPCPSWCVAEHKASTSSGARQHRSPRWRQVTSMHRGWPTEDAKGKDRTHLAYADVQLWNYNNFVGKPTIWLTGREEREGEMTSTTGLHLTLEEAVKLAGNLLAAADLAAGVDVPVFGDANEN